MEERSGASLRTAEKEPQKRQSSQRLEETTVHIVLGARREECFGKKGMPKSAEVQCKLRKNND
jgi:hypothetical protein